MKVVGSWIARRPEQPLPAFAGAMVSPLPPANPNCSIGHGCGVRPSATAGARRLPRAILFELSNVLHDATLWHRWLWQLLGHVGVQRDFQSFCDTWQRDHLPAVHRGHREFCATLRIFLTDLGLSPGQIDEVEAASQARRRELGAKIRPLPGVAKTLAQLSGAGICLGVLADTKLNGRELQERIQRLRLPSSFRCVLSSVDLRCSMPAAASYQAALSALQLPAHEVTFVGCDTDDLSGAAALGLATIAVNHQPDAEADFYLRRFDELLAICLPAAAACAA